MIDAHVCRPLAIGPIVKTALLFLLGLVIQEPFVTRQSNTPTSIDHWIQSDADLHGRSAEPPFQLQFRPRQNEYGQFALYA